MTLVNPLSADIRSRAAALFAQRHGENPYLTDPARWVKERRHAWVTRQQNRIYESVRDHRYTAVPSAHELGKSFCMGNLAVWWVDTHPIVFDPDPEKCQTAMVVTTSDTAQQVRGVLWKEIGRAHAASGAPGKLSATEWKVNIGDHQELVGIGIKPADTNPTAAHGWHATHMLVIIDEACGVPKDLFDALEGLVPRNLDNTHRVVATGNPTDPQSYFAEICQPGSLWNVVQLDAFDSPNFTDEAEHTPRAVRNVLPTPEWAEERARAWGEDSPMYVSRVRGRFPEDSEDGVVRVSDVAKCQRADEYLPDDSRLLPVRGGLDVGAGGDKSVLVVAYGRRPILGFEDVSRKSETVVAKTMLAIKEHRITQLKVDTIGWGWGVAGHLRDKIAEEELNCEVIDVNVSTSATDDRFPRLRDQLWWTIGREMSEAREWDLSRVGDQALADLLAPKWAPNTKGQIKVESKDETRARIKRSPDHGDALLLAYFGGAGGLQSYLDALVRKQAGR